MKEKPKNVHGGHRKRLRELVRKVGLENLNEIQALEFALTYVLPRRNTNEIAHDLLSTFGSFSAVFNAPIEELKKIKYLGEDSAKMLFQFKNIFEYYKQNRSKQIKTINNTLELAAYFYDLFFEKEKEILYAMSLDDKGNIKAVRKIATGNDKLITIEKSEIAKFLYGTKGNTLVLAHNHPNASCMPSKTDDDSTLIIKEWMNSISFRLLDHIIVGKDGVFSFNMIRVISLEELKDFRKD